MTDNSTDEKIYRTYPMFMIACKGAFHGRTLGSLMGTVSRKIHHIGFPKGAFYRHITYNGDPAELAEMLETRPITEILDSPGGVKAVVDSGKVPVDLVGVFLAEPFQGEGGYKPGDPAFFQGVTEILKKYDIPYMSDEVQSFARTGKLFATEHLGVTPDILSTAKGAFVGITVGPAEWERYLHDGWHSNTWGGGKVFDTHIAATTIDTLENYRDPVFDGLSYMENETVKGKYLEMLLDDLHSRHPDVFFGAEGVGLMQSLKVADRAKFLSTAWKYGLKFLSAGLLDENGNGKVRLLMLADTLATEVEDLVVNLDNVFTAMEG
jgi:4-aminobutyrate aminotransferase